MAETRTPPRSSHLLKLRGMKSWRSNYSKAILKPWAMYSGSVCTSQPWVKGLYNTHLWVNHVVTCVSSTTRTLRKWFFTTIFLWLMCLLKSLNHLHKKLLRNRISNLKNYRISLKKTSSNWCCKCNVICYGRPWVSFFVSTKLSKSLPESSDILATVAIVWRTQILVVTCDLARHCTRQYSNITRKWLIAVGTVG